jgi:hypothetical protein
VLNGEIVIANQRGLDFDALRLRIHPASCSSRLRPTLKAHFFEEAFYLQGNRADVRPANARTRVQIDAQLVRMIQVT